MAVRAPEQFTVRSERCDGLALVTMTGLVGGGSAAALGGCSSAALGRPGSTVVLDLVDVVDIDADGVAALLWFQDLVRDTGRQLVLHQPSKRILATLRRAGLASPLSTHPAPRAPAPTRRRPQPR